MTQMRLALQTMLEAIQQAADETPHVYFDPPQSVRMVYPCFVYHFTGYNVLRSNDRLYLRSEEYAVRYITKKADPEIPKAMMELPRITFDRHYVAENLHHFMYVVRSSYYHEDLDVDLDLSSVDFSFLGGNND